MRHATFPNHTPITIKTTVLCLFQMAILQSFLEQGL
jgi:hypothetical protein